MGTTALRAFLMKLDKNHDVSAAIVAEKDEMFVAIKNKN